MKIKDIKGEALYKYKKTLGGKSGASVYMIEKQEKGVSKQEEKVLKIYNTDNLDRDIREISVYCIFNKIYNKLNLDEMYVPVIEEMGIINKESNIKPNKPYIITSKARGIGLDKLLYNNKILNNNKLCYDIMVKILENLLDINKKIYFSHEDLHPGNIMIDIDNTEQILKNVTFIDFDLAEVGDIHYEDNKINPIKRPYSRRITKCVPNVLNEVIKKFFENNKDIYNNFLKRFNKCNISTSVFKSEEEFDKIILDRVVVIYYLFIFGYLLKDKVVNDLENDIVVIEKEKEKRKSILEKEKKQIEKELTEKHIKILKEIKGYEKEINDKKYEIQREKDKDYVETFFENYNNLINSVSNDNTTNIYFYEQSIVRFKHYYNNINDNQVLKDEIKKSIY